MISRFVSSVIRWSSKTKPFGFQAFRPGPGAGGHGLPLDPSCLPHADATPGNGLRMVSLARDINARMPQYVIQRATQLLDVLGLAGSQHKLVVDYSTGMRKKIGLASALLHNPEVLFLDEPFEGVDPVSAQTIREVLEGYTASGATVVFSSHVMELVESLCDWVAVMAAGTIRADGAVAEVRGEAASLQAAFLELVGAQDRSTGGTLDWLGGAR